MGKKKCCYCSRSSLDGFQIDMAHVKGKEHFSSIEDDITQNLIPLCKDHHYMFDVTRSIGLYRDPRTDLILFVNHGCCGNGYCFIEPLRDVFENEYIIQNFENLSARKILQQYIDFKNREILNDYVVAFLRNPNRFQISKCLNYENRDR